MLNPFDFRYNIKLLKKSLSPTPLRRKGALKTEREKQDGCFTFRSTHPPQSSLKGGSFLEFFSSLPSREGPGMGVSHSEVHTHLFRNFGTPLPNQAEHKQGRKLS
jgi:hypothetical protein